MSSSLLEGPFTELGGFAIARLNHSNLTMTD